MTGPPRRLAPGLILFAVTHGLLPAADWPQLQRDAARAGYTAETVAPPYRARWIWCGPESIARNRDSVTNWPDDLRSRGGYSLPLPATSSVTLAESVQPILAGGRVFAATQEGFAFALDAATGATCWITDLGDAVLATAASMDDRVAFVTTGGSTAALEARTGRVLWRHEGGRTITAAPCLAGGRLLVVDHGGVMRAFEPDSGRAAWACALGAPVDGGLAADAEAVYAVSEDLRVHRVRLGDGRRLAARRVRGQSARFNHPVVSGGRVWCQTTPVPCIGSEYTLEQVFADSPTPEDEERNVGRWLDGDDRAGRWPEASPDWRHLFALNTADLAEPFRIACGPVGGCGIPPESVCVDGAGRVLAWWPTRHPFLTKIGSFGTKYSTDISSVDAATGRRVAIDNGRLSGMWPGPETDNCYAMSVAGETLWLRQRFRGTQTLDLCTSAHRFVQAEVRRRDGGVFGADVVYAETDDRLPLPAQRPASGRAAPAITGGRVYLAEAYGIVCIEHAGPTDPAGPTPRPDPLRTPRKTPVPGAVAPAPLAAAGAHGVDAARCIRDHPEVSGIRGADDLRERLRDETDRILEAGPLAPLRLAYGDVRTDFQFLYGEPARIVTTLAWAYPHLDTGRQARVRERVRQELSLAFDGPATAMAVPAQREIHPKDRRWDEGSTRPPRRPVTGILYGLWLYGHRSRDWAPLRTRWPALRTFHAEHAERGMPYGVLGAHIAIARMAERFDDPATAARAREALAGGLLTARNLSAAEDIARTPWYADMYAPRKQGQVVDGWIFLDLCPEIGRWLRETAGGEVRRRHEEGLRRYPLWWIAAAPYFCRWTGDESVGLSPEVFGMFVPVERWVLGGDAPTLRRWMRSHPTGIGDCHWIEALVLAIEAHGATMWTDVKDSESAAGGPR